MDHATTRALRIVKGLRHVVDADVWVTGVACSRHDTDAVPAMPLPEQDPIKGVRR